jgi:hypothetical protein
VRQPLGASEKESLKKEAISTQHSAKIERQRQNPSKAGIAWDGSAKSFRSWDDQGWHAHQGDTEARRNAKPGDQAGRSSRELRSLAALGMETKHSRGRLCHRSRLGVNRVSPLDLGMSGEGYNDPHDVMLHFNLSPRKRRLNVLLDLVNRRRAVLSAEATCIVHKNDVVFYFVLQN